MAARSDKLFKSKRRAKTVKSLARRKPVLTPNERILIVCEGEVTEVEYFEHLKNVENFCNVDIEICGKECGSSPMSVVEYAVDRAKSEGVYTAGGYDRVYCVFDRDSHRDFEAAKSRVLALNKSAAGKLFREMAAIWSIPCFEVWLLFHFIYTRKPFAARRGMSAGGAVTKKLQTCTTFEDFEKRLSNENCSILEDNIEVALSNAKKALKDFEGTGDPNPTTLMHILIYSLRDSNTLN